MAGQKRITPLVATLAFLMVCGSSQGVAQGNRDRILFLDGEVLNGRLMNDVLKFSTNYGDINIPPRYVRRIQRLGDTERLETLNNETMTGHLMDEALRFDVGGGTTLDVRKERVDKLVLAQRESAPRTYQSYFQMQNGDVFYGKVTNPSFALTTNYGVVNIPFANIVRIEEASGQTRVHLADGNVMQGFIATNFLFVTMNYGFDVRIPKNSIRAVVVHR
jgi:hypothetical protein